MSQAAEAGHAGRCVPAGRPSGSRNRNTQPLTPGQAASGATHAPRPRRAQAEPASSVIRATRRLHNKVPKP